MRRSGCLSSLLLCLACAAPAYAHPGAARDMPARSLTISGGVATPLSIDADALGKRPAAQVAKLQLPGKEGGKPSELAGIRLRDLLDEAKIVTADHNTVKKLAIVATATDGYKVVFSWSELFNSPVGDGVLVLFARDGKPLGSEEGPLALISGKDLRMGPRHVKWLQSVEVRQIVD